MRVTILGSGLVGSVIAADLAREPRLKLRVVDASERSLETARRRCGVRGGKPRGDARVRFEVADAGSPREIARLVADADLVMGALPSRLGLQAVRAVIEEGRPMVDISFMAEDFLSLDRLARRRGVTVVPDCGVAPGLSNMLAASLASRLGRCERVEIVVGGLPVERRGPFQYKAAFSPMDVIEEYTRPARVVERGRVKVRPPMTDSEMMDLPGVGTVEAFLTDGLRSLARTLKVPFMRERTLRWPGHADLIRDLHAIGMFSTRHVDAAGQRVRPIDLTSRLLVDQWQYGPGEADLTVMRVWAEGRRGGRTERLWWDLLDHHDRGSGFSSMSRTTAFPATSVARQMLAGKLRGMRGVVAPERLGQRPAILKRVMRDLADRGVSLRSGASPLD
jgi:saccharopine dehydrogenase-like NADP-dependent oxidoreductase